jgi:hypothetical protein
MADFRRGPTLRNATIVSENPFALGPGLRGRLGPSAVNHYLLPAPEYSLGLTTVRLVDRYRDGAYICTDRSIGDAQMRELRASALEWKT